MMMMMMMIMVGSGATRGQLRALLLRLGRRLTASRGHSVAVLFFFAVVVVVPLREVRPRRIHGLLGTPRAPRTRRKGRGLGKTLALDGSLLTQRRRSGEGLIRAIVSSSCR